MKPQIDQAGLYRVKKNIVKQRRLKVDLNNLPNMGTKDEAVYIPENTEDLSDNEQNIKEETSLQENPEQKFVHTETVNTSSKSNTIGILSILFGVIMPIIGLILGIIGVVQSNKTDNKSTKKLCIIGIITSVVVPLILGIIIVSLFFKGMKSDSNLLYGSTSEEKVIKRYIEALNDCNNEDAVKCFPDDLEITLTGKVWSDKSDTNPIYNKIDMNTLNISKNEEQLSIEEYSSKFNLSLTSIDKYNASCSYGEQKTLNMEFVVCKYSGRYYLLDASELSDDPDLYDDEYDDYEDMDDSDYSTITDASFVDGPLGNKDIGYINTSSEFMETNELDGVLHSLDGMTGTAYKTQDSGFYVCIMKVNNDTYNTTTYTDYIKDALTETVGSSNVTVSDAKIAEYDGKKIYAKLENDINSNYFIFTDNSSNLYIIYSVYTEEYTTEADNLAANYSH